MNWLRFAALAAAIGMLSGCSAGRSHPGSAAGTPPPKMQSYSQAQSVKEKAMGEKLKRYGKTDIDYLKVNLHSDMTTEQVMAKYGAGYTRMTARDGKHAVWRYDFGSLGYQYQFPRNPQGLNIAKPDIDALSKGMVHMQLFIGWDPATGRTGGSELYYKSSDSHADHNVKVYKVNPDGSTMEADVPR